MFVNHRHPISNTERLSNKTNQPTRRVKWAMKVVSMSSPRHKKRLYADQKLCLKRRQDINPNGSFKDINALQSYNLFVSQPPQQGNRYNDTRVWMMDEGKIPYEGQQGLENSQELLWWRGKCWLLTNILIAVVIHGTNMGNRPVQTVFCNPLRFIIVVVFILRRSLMNSGPLFSALIELYLPKNIDITNSQQHLLFQQCLYSCSSCC